MSFIEITDVAKRRGLTRNEGTLNSSIFSDFILSAEGDQQEHALSKGCARRHVGLHEVEDDVTFLGANRLAGGAIVSVVDVGPGHYDRRCVTLLSVDLKPFEQ